MEFFKIIPRALWKLFFLLNFLTGLILLYPFFRILLLNKKWFPIAFRLMRFWAKWVVIVPGIIVRKEERFPISEIKSPCVFCANHQSYLDIVLSYCVFPQYFIFLGKAELKKAPLFRVFFERMNILVERKNKIASANAYKKCAERLENGESVFLFPEGTISSSGKMIHFKSGAAKLAIQMQVPIVPVTYVNNYTLLQNGGLFKSFGKPGIARVVIHKPIDTNGMSEENLVHLNQQLFETIIQPLKDK